MVLFRAYVIGRDGHIVRRFEFEAASDDEALERARGLVDNHDVELWQGNRLVALLKHTDKAA